MSKRTLIGFVLAIGALAIAPAQAQTRKWTCTVNSTSRTITVVSANVRSGPNTGTSVLARIPRGAVICPLETVNSGAWYGIAASDGTRGYVAATLTTPSIVSAKLSPAMPVVAPVATVPPPPRVARAAFEFGAQIDALPALDDLTQTGMVWVKRQVILTNAEPDQSQLIRQVHSANMKLLIGAIGDIKRVDDLDYHRQFAAGLARLASQGADAIEVWNQPNLDREWGGPGSNKVNPELYANMLREAFVAIKGANPKTIVIGANAASTGYYGSNCTPIGCDDKPYLERLHAAGAANYMDCQGAMFLGGPHAPDVREGGNPGGHYSWYFWGTLDTVYAAMGKPLCFSFLGYASKEGIRPEMPPGFEWANRITTEQQSAWNARAIELARDSGKVQLAILYNWNFRAWYDTGDPQAAYSLVRPDGSCPTCAALRATVAK